MEILDRELLLTNVDSDRDLLAEIVKLFFDSSGELLDCIRRAVSRADSAALCRSAHQLKGALANVGAKAATEAARELEDLGNRGTMTGLEDALFQLECELNRLAPELQDLAGSGDG